MHQDVKTLAVRFKEELRRFYYVTPTNFLELFKMFKKVLEKRQLEIRESIQRYIKGVQILEQSKI